MRLLGTKRRHKIYYSISFDEETVKLPDPYCICQGITCYACVEMWAQENPETGMTEKISGGER